ncbi:adenylosuccinate synthetase, partial [Patescibacteria group bacterium]|nr:adenylosuccinate synthetase [Patescibacteria group bacterium]
MIGSLLNGVSTLAVVCTQWGDTGKGKFVDFFAEEWADVIARGT